jgi:2-polyprenyl-6-hydroxyphenyl methylase/3-demethylubiquinone-9 3-methyltransferase
VLHIKRWVPADGLRILEVGCGEGMVTSRLAAAYPDSEITGIDITPRVGRMYKGDSKRVAFRQQAIGDFSSENPNSIDLVVLADVMHHVPRDMRKEFLVQVGRSLKRGGHIILKDWMRSRAPIHLLVYSSDRYITGDRVYYRTICEWRSFIEDIFGHGSIKDEARIKPWSSNAAFFIKP